MKHFTVKREECLQKLVQDTRTLLCQIIIPTKLSIYESNQTGSLQGFNIWRRMRHIYLSYQHSLLISLSYFAVKFIRRRPLSLFLFRCFVITSMTVLNFVYQLLAATSQLVASSYQLLVALVVAKLASSMTFLFLYSARGRVA